MDWEAMIRWSQKEQAKMSVLLGHEAEKTVDKVLNEQGFKIEPLQVLTRENNVVHGRFNEGPVKKLLEGHKEQERVLDVLRQRTKGHVDRICRRGDDLLFVETKWGDSLLDTQLEGINDLVQAGFKVEVWRVREGDEIDIETIKEPLTM